MTGIGQVVLGQALKEITGRPPSMADIVSYGSQIEASVDRALTPTAEIRQHINGTCWCRYITIPEEYVEWVG